MKEGIGMLFKKKTLDEKMEKYVKHHDWYAIQEVITGSKEEKIAAAKALGASDDQTRVDLLLRFIEDTDHDVVFAAMDELRKPADKLEMLVAKSAWPFPSYGDLIFEV